MTSSEFLYIIAIVAAEVPLFWVSYKIIARITPAKDYGHGLVRKIDLGCIVILMMIFSALLVFIIFFILKILGIVLP